MDAGTIKQDGREKGKMCGCDAILQDAHAKTNFTSHVSYCCWEREREWWWYKIPKIWRLIQTLTTCTFVIMVNDDDRGEDDETASKGPGCVCVLLRIINCLMRWTLCHVPEFRMVASFSLQFFDTWQKYGSNAISSSIFWPNSSRHQISGARNLVWWGFVTSQPGLTQKAGPSIFFCC